MMTKALVPAASQPNPHMVDGGLKDECEHFLSIHVERRGSPLPQALVKAASVGIVEPEPFRPQQHPSIPEFTILERSLEIASLLKMEPGRGLQGSWRAGMCMLMAREGSALLQDIWVVCKQVPRFFPTFRWHGASRVEQLIFVFFSYS